MLPGQSDAYLQDRANTMQSIESTIVELGGIFQQLAHMIKEQVIYTYNHTWFFLFIAICPFPIKYFIAFWQEEVMLRIDANVEDTQAQVEMGHTELLKYFQVN